MPQVAPTVPRARAIERAYSPLLVTVMALLPGSGVPIDAGFIGETRATSFSVCEEAEDDNGDPRPECQAGDIRFELETSADDPVLSEFAFALATGLLNGDELADLVVGDPARDRVYVFFGRKSVVAGYDLNPEELFDREVSPEDQADVILAGGPALAGSSFGFSVAVGREGVEGACAPDDLAHPLLIGAPGQPGTATNAPGRAVYIPAGALCMPATDPAAPMTLDPLAIGDAFQAPVVDENDEFGYSVAFGRILTHSSSDEEPVVAAEDVVVGARGARGGAGRVTIFPVSAGGVIDVQQVVELEGAAGDRLGEVLAVGDLDGDYDPDLNPTGNVDDLAAGAVGQGAGKVLLLAGPLAHTGGTGGDGVFRAGDREVRAILGEQPGDFFGFSLAVNGDGLLAVGAIYADNDPPAAGEEGGDDRTNVGTAARINAGKVYGWAPSLFDSTERELGAATADLVIVARRSGDQLGFAVAFEDLDGSGEEDLMVTARREDGSGLTLDEIDHGTAYVILDSDAVTSPVDLNKCVTSSDCTGVAGIGLMVFGGDRDADRGDEMGFAAATGDFNGDGFDDLFLSSLTHNRVYALTFEDSDDDRAAEGRNIRDDDDDEDLDPDSTDCAPLDPLIFAEAEEIVCNDVDENCNGLADDAPDADRDGFDVCGDTEVAPDCDDSDPHSYPGAPERCDGNKNTCAGSLPTNELDLDDDGYVGCSGYDDTQDDDPEILGGDDCDVLDPATFPGAAPHEANPAACRTDFDGDDFGDPAPFQGVTPGTDCDDLEAGTFPGAAPLDNPAGCLRDVDDDGYGDALAADPVLDGSDCDDDDPLSFPGASERCDGNDNSCAGDVLDIESDLDGDGWVACRTWADTQGDDPGIAGGGDCNESDPDTSPGAAPREPLVLTCMRDADGDDFGDLAPPPGVARGTDCDDDSATTFPGAAVIDGPLNCMKDDDDDGYGDDSVALPVVPGRDCDDDDATRFSGATDVPDDGIDQDCNGFDTLTCFVDDDGDHFGTTTELLAGDGDCTDEGESGLDTDCDDTDETVFPGSAEVPDDDIDQDCNGFDTIACTVDADRDGFGDRSGTSVLAGDGSCDADEGESASADDCDDTDRLSFPGASERCDGNDNACAGQVPVVEVDGDGDTYVDCLGWDDTQGDNPGVGGGDDCNDQASDTFPGAAARQSATACMKDRDGDGFGDLAPPTGVTPGTDCDDIAADTFPGAALVDGPLNCMKDSDDDEHGDALVSLPVVRGTDCDDGDPRSFLGAPELCDGNDNACAGAVPVDETDVDGDAFVVCAGWDDTQVDDPGIAGGGDCDGTDVDTFPGAAPNERAFPLACRTDRDGDDFGELLPAPAVSPGTDCDDGSAHTFPGAAQIEGPLNCMEDDDDDGYGDDAAVLPVVAGRDCDDGLPLVNPGTREGPQGDPSCSDGLDNDCDDLLDDQDPVCSGAVEVCPDADNDGFADCVTHPTCDATGRVCGDCNDSAAVDNPDAAEVCDNRDNDCDGSTDEGFDLDSDSYTSCDLPVADCDDSDPLVNPGVVLELCNDGLDNDCDAATPDRFDGDHDGASCDADCDDGDPALNLDDGDSDSFSTCAGDCNDGDPAIRPSATELCNDGIDNDCNAATPDRFDSDGDGATCDVDCNDGDAALNLHDTDSDTFTSCAGDCNDADPAVKPGATEICDGIDNDCNAALDEGFDLDGDTFTVCNGDCNDGNPAIKPGAPEVCADGVDNDCDAGTPDLSDADGDGAACDADCDDGDSHSFPGAPERCDGNDNACAGTVPAAETDGDGDSYVACSGWADTQGDNPGIVGGDDCDTADSGTFPGAAPNESFPTACMRDQDGDDFGDQSPPSTVVPGTDCDDGAVATFPGAAEIEAPLNCMKDGDGDGWGDSAVSLPVVPGTDCADDDAARFPGAAEVCGDGIDSDCDGSDPPCSAATLRSGDKPLRFDRPPPADTGRPGKRGGKRR